MTEDNKCGLNIVNSFELPIIIPVFFPVIAEEDIETVEEGVFDVHL